MLFWLLYSLSTVLLMSKLACGKFQIDANNRWGVAYCRDGPSRTTTMLLPVCPIVIRFPEVYKIPSQSDRTNERDVPLTLGVNLEHFENLWSS